MKTPLQQASVHSMWRIVQCRGSLAVIAGMLGTTTSLAQPAAVIQSPRNDSVLCTRAQGECSTLDRMRQMELVNPEVELGSGELRPTTPKPDGSAPQDNAASGLQVSSLVFVGASDADKPQLQRMSQPLLDRQVTLADLEKLAQSVTRWYQERGFFLAQAFVPAQKVREGRVEISVVEGRLGRILFNVAEDVPVKAERIAAMAAALRTGEPLTSDTYERTMLLLSDLPGIKVSSGLQAGQESGYTDLVLNVVADKRVLWALDADNHGVKESGRLRAGGTMRIASPFGMGDNLDARALISQGSALTYGRLSWETPLGYSGLRAGLGVGRSSYELEGPFADLGAKGTAQIADISLHYPLIRQRNENLFLRMSADIKNLRDEMGALEYVGRKRIHGLSLGWSWEKRDNLGLGGYWASNGALYFGHLNLRDDISKALDLPPAGRQTAGGFTKLSWHLSRLQSIAARHLLYVAVTGQFTNQNLDVAEKIALGGPRAVRAYASGEVLADQGFVATMEWRWAATDSLTPFLFVDAARGKLAHKPTPLDGDVHRSLRGTGLGLVWSKPQDFSLTATLAWRLNSPAGMTDGGGRNPRLYVQLQKVF